MASPVDDRTLLSELLAGDPPASAPSDPILFDYLAGRLPEPAAERVRAWAAADPAHAERLLELAPFATAEPAPPGVVDFEARAAWRDFERRRREAERPARPAFRPAWAAAAAAVLLIASGGLGLRVWQLEQAARRPVVNLRTLELLGETRGEGSPPRLEVAAGEPFRLALYPAPLPEGCSSYDGALRGSPGERTTPLTGLVPDLRGRLDLLLPGRRGAFLLELEACGEARGRFRFELVAR